jgi:hypothetical protein
MLLRHRYRPLILPSDQAHVKLDRDGYPTVTLSSIGEAVVAVHYELILVSRCQVVQHESVEALESLRTGEVLSIQILKQEGHI